MARNKAVTPVAPVASTPITTVVPMPSRQSGVITFRRTHPGGGVLGRCSYGVAGVPGIVVFDVALFAGGVMPETITLMGVALAQPTARRVAGVTSAVVAQGNLNTAQAAGAPIATPATVAEVAAPAVVAALAAK